MGEEQDVPDVAADTGASTGLTWWAWVAIGIGVVLILALAVVAFVLAPDLYPEPSPPLDPPDPNPIVQAARLSRYATEHSGWQTAVSTTRTSVLAALAGVGALVTISINYRNSQTNSATLRATQGTLRVTERGHQTGRYTAAIEQLGNDTSIAIRLGGIYALEQLAVDSGRPGDQATVVEVLSAFIRLPRDHPRSRSRADATPPPTSAPTPPPTTRRREVAGTRLRPPPRNENRPEREVGLDVQAALTVLGRLPHLEGVTRADLSGAVLTGADLSGAVLTGADLFRADLTGANLTAADLTGAGLSTATLTGAVLSGAVLTGADLFRADLTDANLTAATLTGADLSWADLTGVNLFRATLTGADLSRTVLIEADLSWADLTDANLTAATPTGADLSRTVLTGANLTEADLTGAGLSTATLTRAVLNWADLTGAHLSAADLTDAHLRWADLTDTNLTAATLTGADLTEADLTGADLSRAVGVDLSPEQHASVAVLPAGASPAALPAPAGDGDPAG